MAPSKASRTGQDDAKQENPHTKEKNGATNTHQSNGKMRRVVSSAGSNLRDAITSNAGAAAVAASTSTSVPNGAAQEAGNPGVRRFFLTTAFPFVYSTAD